MGPRGGPLASGFQPQPRFSCVFRGTSEEVARAPRELGQGTSVHQPVQGEVQRSLPHVLTLHGTSGNPPSNDRGKIPCLQMG